MKVQLGKKQSLISKIKGRYYSIKFNTKRTINNLKLAWKVFKVIQSGGSLNKVLDTFEKKFPGDVSIATFALWLYKDSVCSGETYDSKNKTITLTFTMKD